MRMRFFGELHPAVSFLYFVLVLALTLACFHPVMAALSLVGAVLFSAQLSGWRSVLLTGRFVLPMFLLIAAANPLLNHRGVTLLCMVFDQWFTLEAVCYGLVSAASFSALIFWFSCYQAVMTSDKFLFLFGQLAPNTALLITMTLGLLPRLRARSAQIRTAQTLLAPEKKRLLPRLHAANRNLSALLTWSMENAVQTADSMKARGYGVRRRTTFHLFVFDTRDAAVLGLVLALGGICALGRAFGHGAMTFYPRMDAVFTGASGAVLYGAFAVLVFFPAILEAKEKLTWRCCGWKD